jgi:hypothetical protein
LQRHPELPVASERVTKMNSTQRMTRRQIAKYLREHGVPVGDSTLDKLCMPTVNEGPPVAVWWGRRPLYDPADALAWAEGRMRRDQNYTSRALKPLPVEQVNSSSDRRRKDNERAGALGGHENASDVT